MQNISTVTICFNNLPDLIATIKSVDSQIVLPAEHLIIDGSTNSEIKDFLENSPQPKYRKWICERDKGISDAFNKGVKNSKNEIIHLLNSGDCYYDETVIEKVTKAFESNPDIKWLHGKFVQFRAGMWVLTGKPFESKKLYRGIRTVGHPSMFVKRALYNQYGLYSLDKKIAMDYDFLVRIRLEKFIFLDYPLVRFSPEGVSEKNIDAGLKEVEESYNKYIGKSLKQKLWMLRIKALHALTGTRLGSMIFKIKNFKNQKNTENN